MQIQKLVLLVFITLLQIVSSYRYVFRNGEISVKSVGAKVVKDKRYRFVTAIDQHEFANAIDLKVSTGELVMYEGAIKNLPHLRNLRLKECGISDLAPGCLKNLPRLELLHLQDNDLTEIRKGVFNYLTVRELWLNRNAIEDIESEAFDNMPNLRTIRLNKNKLKVWDNRWFANTPQLTRIFFRKNKLEELPARAFVNIKTSHKVQNRELVDTEIYLSRNKISYIHPEALYGIDSLAELNLQRNYLESLDSRVFAHMTELHKLMLSNNEISEIHKNTFENIDLMEFLDLSANKLTCIPFEMVEKASKVNLTANEPFECDCLFNLRDKLSEMKSSHQIIAENIDCPLD